MLEFLLNVLALLRKEALMILKDKRGRIVLIMPLIVQTVIFGHVATYDLNNVEYALLDEDHSWSSRKLVEQFDGSPIFHRVITLKNSSESSDVLDNKKALMVLHIGTDFERQLNLGKTVPVQVLVDGRNSNTAGTASNYASSLVETFNSNRLQDKGMTTTKLAISCRSWFNPNLETRWGMLSALIAVLALIQVMVLAGQSVAREKEQGTFDQLLVTPFGPMTIMLGKALPPVLIGLVQSSIVFFFAMNVFSIPYAGSFLLLYLSLILFNFAVVGIGLCVSAFSSTMQQSMLYCFTLLMPMVLLSGFATPVSSMPEIFQWATLLNPVRYAVEFTQRIYLEGAGFNEIQQTLWPLLAIAVWERLQSCSVQNCDLIGKVCPFRTAASETNLLPAFWSVILMRTHISANKKSSVLKTESIELSDKTAVAKCGCQSSGRLAIPSTGGRTRGVPPC